MATRSVTLQEARGYKLAAVEIDVRPATISWGDGEVAFMVARGLDTNDPASANALTTAEGKAAFEKVVTERIASRIRPVLASQLNGARPVKVTYVFKRIYVPSTASRMVASVLIGSIPPGMLADVTVTDAASGTTLLQLADNGSSLLPSSGILGAAITAAVEGSMADTAFDRLATAQGVNFATWLLAE